MKRYLVTVFLIFPLLLISQTLLAETERVTEKVGAEDVEKLDIDIRFSAGDLIIYTEDMAEAAVADIAYDPEKVEYYVDYMPRDEVGHLELGCELKKHRNFRKLKNDWDVRLSNRYPSEINMELGACEAEIDLGGIPMTDLDIEIGAASGELDFSKPNPTRLRELTIDIGASSMTINNLGNANFDFLEFSSGAASCELDLHGKYEGTSEIEISVGVGSLDLYLPEDIPVRIKTDGSSWFSSIDFHNDNLEEIDDDTYESPGFDKADDRLIITVEVGMGSIDFYWK